MSLPTGTSGATCGNGPTPPSEMLGTLSYDISQCCSERRQPAGDLRNPRADALRLAKAPLAKISRVSTLGITVC
jgi:hypothetical protein